MFVCVLCCICHVEVIRAQVVPAYTLESPEPFDFELFGASLAINEERILIGAPDDLYFKGKAFLFDANTGSYLRAFSHPTPKEGNFFGGYVGLGAGYAAVMAEVTTENYSEVFIFDLESGELERTIQFPTFVSEVIGNYKGNSLAVFGRNILIGASDYDFGRNGFGIAYLYDALTGDLLESFVDPVPQRNDYFGSTVALNDEYVVIAARGDDTTLDNAGQVFVFDLATGDLLHSISDPSPMSTEYFGWSLAVEGDTIVIGNPGDPYASGTEPGEAFLFDVATGTMASIVPPESMIGNARFGSSIAMDNGLLVVGAFRAVVDGVSTGQAYVYDVRTNEYLKSLSGTELMANDFFGGGVAISDSRIAVSASASDWFGLDSGRAYFFELQVPEPTTALACQIMALVILSSRSRRSF